MDLGRERELLLFPIFFPAQELGYVMLYSPHMSSHRKPVNFL